MTGYVALYCRISKDRNERAEGVRVQEKLGREYAAITWPGLPVRVFTDNDISAADESAHRPDYEELRKAIAGGEVAHLWAVSQARLSRTYGWFGFAAEMAAAGLEKLHTRHDGIINVLDTIAGIKAVINVGEVRDLKKRQRDALDDRAARGVAPGSRPFGYVHGVSERGDKTLIIVKAQAKVIRECADRILAGWSLSSIAADLRKRKCETCPDSEPGHTMHGPHRMQVRDAAGAVITEDGTPVDDGGRPKTRSSTITGMSVKQWVTNPSVAGKRVYRGEIVGAGNWPAILDENTWQAVRGKLTERRTVKTLKKDGSEGEYPVRPRARTTGRRYLLTGGTAVCGECRAPLVAQMKQFSRKLADGSRVIWKIAPYYQCHPKTGGKGCIGIMGDELESHVVDQLMAELEKPEFLNALPADDNGARRDEIGVAFQAIEQQRVELSRMWALPLGHPEKLTAAEWQAARVGLADEEGRLRRELNEIQLPPTVLNPASLRADWGTMPLDEQRDTISEYIDRVTVKRARPGTVGFDVGRVDITMREW